MQHYLKASKLLLDKIDIILLDEIDKLFKKII